MKNFLIFISILLIAVLFTLPSYSAGKQLPMYARVGLTNATVDDTLRNSYVDTVVFNREAGLSAFAFAAHFKDSVSVTKVIVKRVVDGTVMALQAGDTLTNFTSFVSTVDGNSGTSIYNDGIGVTNTVAVAPLADMYLFIITYAGSANGVTTPFVRYEVIKQYSAK